jgi:methylmalonyl-CoA mutase N-terminal domain/subunit
MGTRPAGSTRGAAVRAAHEVAARRAKAVHEREQEITGVLTDYFEAKARSEKIRTVAQAQAGRLIESAEHKAHKLTADAHAASRQLTEQAEKDAADFDAQVGTAVRRLLDLGESKASVAEMTGLSQAVVRAVAREHGDYHPAPPGGRAQDKHPASPGGRAPGSGRTAQGGGRTRKVTAGTPPTQ